MENLAVDPDIQWLYTNGTTVGGIDITVGAVKMMGNRFTHNLTFFPLHTSHGRQYICRTSVDIQAISLSGINSESTINVQSKQYDYQGYSSHYQIRFSVHVLTVVLF